MWSRFKLVVTQFLLNRLDYETELPEDVQNLLDYMEEVGQGQDCVIYQGGQFPMALSGSDGRMLDQPMVFKTNEERAAFGAGVGYASKLFGGATVGFFGNDDIEHESDEMDKRATHRLPHRMS